MPRGFATMADYYRAHREEMELALATGCTPIEARAELRRRAKARRDQCGTRAAVPTDNQHRFPEGTPASQGQFGDWRAPWMMRD
jgi:hypothetical protein